jgi:REP element-mobilizing transposase RayT
MAKHLPHYQSDYRTYFVTFVTRDRRVLPDVARDIALRHVLWDHGRRMTLHTAVIMPDHVHLLMTPLPDREGCCISLAMILQGIKGASARSINVALGTTGQVWQHESFDHELRRDEDVREKGEYISRNPLRKGLCSTPDEYPWLWRQWVESAT